MTKKYLVFISLSLVLLTLILGTDSVNAKEIPSSTTVTTQEVEPRINIICPACGAVGYPTGRVIPMARSIEDTTPDSARIIPLYQEMKCSANSSHIWYEYIGDATD